MPNVELFMTRTKLRQGVRTTRANFFVVVVFLVGAIRPKKMAPTNLFWFVFRS